MSFNDRLDIILNEMQRREFLQRTGGGMLSVLTGKLGINPITAKKLVNSKMVLKLPMTSRDESWQDSFEQVTSAFGALSKILSSDSIKGGADEYNMPSFMTEIGPEQLVQFAESGWEIEDTTKNILDGYTANLKTNVKSYFYYKSNGLKDDADKILKHIKRLKQKIATTKVVFKLISPDGSWAFASDNDLSIDNLKKAAVVDDPIKMWWSEAGKHYGGEYSGSGLSHEVDDLADIIRDKNLEPPDGFDSWDEYVKYDKIHYERDIDDKDDEDDREEDFEDEYREPAYRTGYGGMHQPFESRLRLALNL